MHRPTTILAQRSQYALHRALFPNTPIRAGRRLGFTSHGFTFRLNPMWITQWAPINYTCSSFFFVPGSWDSHIAPFSHTQIYQEIRDLYRADLNYRATEAYQMRLRQLNAGTFEKHRGVILDTIDKVDLYFERYCDLIQSISAYGYHSNASLSSVGQRSDTPATSLEVARNFFSGPETNWYRHKSVDLQRHSPANPDKEEIGFTVDRQGSLTHYRRGTHRLAICQVLGIKEVTARLHFVHARWFDRQFRLRVGTIPEILRNSILDVEGVRPG